MPLWDVGERSRVSIHVWLGPCPRGTLPAHAGAKGVSVINSPTPEGLLTRRLAPTPPVHVQVHRVVEAEDHLPPPVEHLHVAQRHSVRYEPLPFPSERRAYGGRKDQRNLLRSRFPYEKVCFHAPAERLRKTMSCLCGMWESVPAAA